MIIYQANQSFIFGELAFFYDENFSKIFKGEVISQFQDSNAMLVKGIKVPLTIPDYVKIYFDQIMIVPDPGSSSGYQGPQGATGGLQGTQGNNGSQGTQGNIGTQGTQGNIGYQGASGIGVQGLQGNTGVGTQGVQGLQGTAGGIQGSQGPSGGLQGTQGFTGLQGNIGDNGTQGVQGSIGFQGNSGIGMQGLQGNKGSQGFTGLGLQGSNGPQGSIGFQGNTGAGSQGLQGNQGSQGFTGTGTQGSQGSSGTASNILALITTTNSNTTIPTTASTVIVDIVGNTIASLIGQNIYISDGTYSFHGIIAAIGSNTITVRALGFTGDSVATSIVATGATVKIDSGQVNTLWHYVSSDSLASITTPALDVSVAGDLEIIVIGTTAGAGNDDACHLQFNGDTNANYSYQIFYMSGATVGGSAYLSQSNIQVMYLSATTRLFPWKIIIGDYQNTSRKKGVSFVPVSNLTYTRGGSGFWTGTAAISTIKFTGLTSSISSGATITIRRIRYN